MCIITDTANKMGITTDLVFDMWACFHDEIYIEDVNKARYDWQKRGIVSSSVTDFCLDILTERIPLIAVPIPRQKAKNLLKGDGSC